VGRVASAFKHRTKSGLFNVRVAVEDLSGAIECSWFTNERMVENLIKQFQVGREVVISGKVTEYLGKLMFQNPLHEPIEKEWVSGGSIVPVYKLTEGLPPLLLRRVMKRLIEYWPTRVQDFVPASVRHATGLIATPEALREIHFPRDPNTLERARRRLAFDELFQLQVAILKQRKEWQDETAQPLHVDESYLESLKGALPYTLTGAQSRAIDAIANDLRQPMAMHRLLQGDVGSGKTVVAALAMALAAQSGTQSALMAPTEILAEQHYKNLIRLFESIHDKGISEPIQVRLLTGSVSAADKRAIYDGLADGSIQIAIGTHALIQEGVSFKNLGIVVVDEQHRFGVDQRKALRTKGQGANPHTLVMTATPIPRTLALTLYGDLENTVLDEMPPGRQPIETHWFTPAERERAYSFVRQQIEQGRQAFIICPLVEESEKIEAKAAVEEHERLQREVFQKYKLGLLHGRMKADAKESVMAQFAAGDLNVLVSTSVVEVGIDVPNATVMIIEGANRFGLSQLHQFRGRVGRGQYHSYCLLIADTSASISDERLMAIVTTQDGFKLAEKDLELRGPGEFFGTRQSGEPEFKLVNIRDRDLLILAREQAERIFQQDPQLATPDNRFLADKVQSFWTARETHGDAS
jgi:ATP-dependent DNA helicase RecG